MKNAAIIPLLAVLFLLNSCAVKETYFFDKPAGSYLTSQPLQKTGSSSVAVTPLSSSSVAPEAVPQPDVQSLTAATGPAALADLPAPVTQAVAGDPAADQQLLPGLLPLLPAGKIRDPGAALSEDSQTAPKGKKKRMLGTVEAGFALSLFGVVSIALVFITPYLLFFSGLLTFTGLILSFVGLLQVSKHKDKLRGKVRAWAGIVLGLLGTAVVLLLLNNNF